METINPDKLQDQVTTVINAYCSKYGINLYNYNQRVNLKHNEVNNILKACYDSIFKPDTTQQCNKKSLLDYDNINQMQAAVDAFINTCLLFNKSLGVYSFCIFTGIDDNTIMRWYSDEGQKTNPWRWALIHNIKENNKNALISNLKDSPVGALAVANNDKETGLEWSKQQQQLQAVNTVYLIPSERSGRLALTDQNNG